MLRRHDHFVKPGRQAVDDVDELDEFLVLGRADPRGHEDRQMPGLRVDAVDDGAPTGTDVLHVAIEVENPAERLLHGADIVAKRGEADDRACDVAQVEDLPCGRGEFVAGELVADEKLIDEPL